MWNKQKGVGHAFQFAFRRDVKKGSSFIVMPFTLSFPQTFPHAVERCRVTKDSQETHVLSTGNPQILWIKLRQLGGGFLFEICPLARCTCYPQAISERCESLAERLFAKSTGYPQNYPQPVYKCLLSGENYTSYQHLWKDWKSPHAYISKGFYGRQVSGNRIAVRDMGRIAKG